MWSYRPTLPPKSSFKKRKFEFVERAFQFKYTAFLLVAVLTSLALWGFPLYFVLSQNFQIFIDLAYHHAPDLVAHLERERSWIQGFMLSVAFSISAFCVYFGFKVTERLVRPLLVLEKQLKKMTRGMFFGGEIKLRESDEFIDLIETYNYFSQSMRAQIESDIEALRKLKVYAQDYDQQKILHELIVRKEAQLGIGQINGAPSLRGVRDPRHAS